MNKEVREFSESIFFGLSLRQFIFSALAVGIAVGLYFLLRGAIGTSEVGWVCILGAMPFAAAGFFHYQGLPLEKFALCWLRSEFVLPRKLPNICENLRIRELRKPSDKKKEAFHVSNRKKRARGQ